MQDKIFFVIRSLLKQLGHQKALDDLDAASDLQKDLGLGSIEQLELLTRLEKTLGVDLSQDILIHSRTIEDLMIQIRRQIELSSIPLPDFPAVTTHSFSSKFIKNQNLQTTISSHHLPSKISQKPPLNSKKRHIGFFKISQVFQSFLGFFYSIYAALSFLVTLLPVWIITVLFKHSAFSYTLTHHWARLWFKLVGCPILIQGLNNIPTQKPVIWVANHASYLDVPILYAILPDAMVFVAKHELTKMPGLSAFIRAQEHIAIDRSHLPDARIVIQKLKAALKQGKSILIFPEATFKAESGIRPFKLGAFKIAQEMRVPICPIVLSGVRSILPAGQWRLHRHRIMAFITPPLYTKTNEFDEIIHLRNITRHRFSEFSGEPELKLEVAGPEA